MRIGIDVGGTNTDGVLLDGTEVFAKLKAPTTLEVTEGIQAVLTGLIEDAGARVTDIAAVMIGTTHFTNAFVHGGGLCSVAVVRLCLPATQAVPPLLDWPEDALARVATRTFLVRGGHEFDGREISAIDEDELRDVADQIAESGLESIAITSVYSSVDPSHELRAAEIFAEVLPGIPVSLSHEIGRTGLLERENATIVNASLRPLARTITRAFGDAVTAAGITSPVYVSQNDGTLATMEFTERYPVTTFTSGPTNSMRGAAFLSGLSDAVVVDIGGTTADIGVLRNGFPRETNSEALVGGVRTNFRLPDVVSLGIGGGSIVGVDPLAVGPHSVGFNIRRDALIFGGSTLTATDLAVAEGRLELGDASLVAHLEPELVSRALAHIEVEIVAAADRMRTSAAPLPVILVGGGSVLIREELPGVSEVRRPPHFEVANAVGAAIAQVSGSCERIYPLARIPRAEAIEEVTAEATALAIAAGADPASVHIVDVEEIAMAYLPDAQTRIKARAVGTLMMEAGHALD